MAPQLNETTACAMALVGSPAPAFALECVDVAAAEPWTARLGDYTGRWLLLIFYPRDFSFVCPTELTAFSARIDDFQQREAELLGISVDSIASHRQWLKRPAQNGGLGPLRFPLASDPRGVVARAFSTWVEEKEVSSRGLFIIDPEGVLQYAAVYNLNVGRGPDEVLRVLDALRTGGLCPANWTSADGVIDPENALQPGRVLGRYRIERKLGGGTFGVVFAAWDLRLERMVAIKVLKRSILESREALLREARPAARLNHPNICTIYAVDEEDGLPVIAMEYLDGRPLGELISAGIKPDCARRLAGEIAAGLAASLEEGIVHGDLKPANVIVSSEGVAKIVDFGLATLQPTTGDDEFDASGSGGVLDIEIPIEAMDETIESTPREQPPGRRTIRGTPAYMSPEQATGQPLTTASDVFSFGLMAFEMFTGRRALKEKSLVRLLDRLNSTQLAGELSSQVPDAHQELLRRTLASDPAVRPTARELAEHFA